MVEIKRATLEDIENVASVFDLYRHHYGEASDPNGCVDFLTERLKLNEAIVFFAADDYGEALGFVQLYPIFCAVPFRRDLFLGDLYVVEDQQGKGIGRKLLMAAKSYGGEINSKGTLLATEVDNDRAQKLYQSLGFEKDSGRYYYYLSL